jgi:2-oxo-4-hydroxy-4-carboxy-5-ureidoimidazoline decarboxylase
MDKLAVSELHYLSKKEYISKIGHVFEDTPEIVEQCYGSLYTSVQGLHNALVEIVNKLPSNKKLDLIRAYPDLV